MQEVDLRIQRLTCRLEFNTHKLGTNIKLEVEEETRDPSDYQGTIMESSIKRTVSQSSLPLLVSSTMTSRESLSSQSSQDSESQPAALPLALLGSDEVEVVHQPEEQATTSPEEETTPAGDLEEDEDEEEEYQPTATIAWMMNVAWTTGEFVEIRIVAEDLEIHHERIKMIDKVSSHHSRVIPLRGEVFY